MTFAERLRELRQGAGLSEAKLAKLSGVSFGAIHNYGLGNRQPTFTSVVRMAKALGVTCDAFADCTDIIGAPSGEAAPAPPPRPKGRPKKAAGGPSETAAGTGQGETTSERPGSGKGHAAGPGAAPAEGEPEGKPRRKGRGKSKDQG